MIDSGALVISDFHLGPGKLSGEFEHFNEDKAFCEFLHFYAIDSDFKNLELIIAGDFFDSIQVKIKDSLPDRVYEHHALAKIQRIVAGHEVVFSTLCHFSQQPGRSITFLVGNHDPATAFSGVRKYLKEVIKGDVKFEVESVVRAPLIVKHGNEWDSANRFESKEIIKHDEAGSFIQFPWGSYLVIDFVNHIRKRVPDIDKIKPLGAFIRWATINRPKDASFAFYHFLRFIWRYRFHPIRDQRVSFGHLIKIVKAGCYSCNLVNSGLSFMQKQKSCILVIGHTHRAMIQRFSDQHVFVNTGTWNPILIFENGRFIVSKFLTYAIYRQPDNVGGNPPEPNVDLMQWIPNQGPTKYQPTFFNIHMHAQMRGFKNMFFAKAD